MKTKFRSVEMLLKAVWFLLLIFGSSFSWSWGITILLITVLIYVYSKLFDAEDREIARIEARQAELDAELQVISQTIKDEHFRYLMEEEFLWVKGKKFTSLPSDLDS